MHIEWDRVKYASNQAKHDLDFETAKLVFEDPCCVTFVERVVEGEDRWRAIGMIEDVVVVAVAHTYLEEAPEEVVRIIPARRASRRERRIYVQTAG